MSDTTWRDEPLTEEWLQSVDFKWHQHERMPHKMWLLWLGDAIPDANSGHDELGLEVTPSYEGRWHCWFRSDVAHRYHRFIHLRYLRTRGELATLVEALTGQAWNPENHIYGGVHRPEYAARLRQESERLDRQMRERERGWYACEADSTRTRPLTEHLEEHVEREPSRE